MSIPGESRTARSTTINWEHFLQTIVEGYEQQRSITYGVQKDAIQNGWDARKKRKGKGFAFSFELVEGANHSYVAMTDRGTTGLTGRVLTPDELFEDLPEYEKWGRFESLAFSKKEDKNTTPLGSRGRGKFIFVGASESRRIIYDSLRDDGSYRSGWRNVVRTDSLVDAFDEDVGRKMLSHLTEDTFSPLNEVGTRVIIEDPIDELKESFENGELEWMIAETWWEIIQKYDAEITITHNGTTTRVEIPKELALPKKSIGSKRVWIKGPVKVKFGKKQVTVKKLHIFCESGKEVREEIRGISIQRGGMKICTVKPDVLPQRIAYSIHGHVCLGRDGESEIRNAEGLEHNTISYNRKFTQDFRLWLRQQMNEFARAQLGYSVDKRKERRERERSAERKALTKLNKIAKHLNLLNVGPSVHTPGTSSIAPLKSIRLQIGMPKFPNAPSRRVDYNETLKRFQVSAVNETAHDVPVRVKAYVRFGDNLILDLGVVDTTLTKGNVVSCIGPMDFTVTKKNFAFPGPYTISIKLVSMSSGPEKGDVLDSRNIVFYVESDPPVKGLFEAYEGIEGLSEENIHLQGYEGRGPAGGIVLKYNVEHPAYSKVQDDLEEIAEYLFRFGAMILCKYDLMSDNPQLFSVEANSNSQKAVEEFSQAMGRLMYLYHISSG
jgi:hypothetical protein